MDTTPRKPPLIELRLWRQFLAVAEELHFGRAAQRLNMTQPPLTQAIAQLEMLLGLRLFDRTKRSVQLTAAGAALVPEARDLLARAQALPAYARASADGRPGGSGWPLSRRWVLTCCRAGCGLFASNIPRCNLS
jgi:DNA-binding transcriptional LysR family regulator